MYVQLLNEDAVVPQYATKGSAGLDLASTEDLILAPGKRVLVSTGIALQLPNLTVGFICPRSGLALKQGLTVLNSPGVIDSDYRGEIKVLLYNAGNAEIVIKKGDRVAQLVIMPFIRSQAYQLKTLPNTERGDGGFGSTGTSALF